MTKKFKNVLGMSDTGYRITLGEGIKATPISVEKARMDKKFFQTFMTNIAIKIARKRGWVCSDDLRYIAEHYKIEAPASGAWGKIFNHARWESIGYVPSVRKQSHSRKIQKFAWIREATQ